MSNGITETKRFLNGKAMAEVLGHTPRYLQLLAEQKLVPYVQLPGRDRIYDREKVVAALNKFEVKAVGQ